MKVVKHNKFLRQSCDDRNLFLSIEIDDFLRQIGIILSGIIKTNLLMDEPIQRWPHLAGRDSRIIRHESPIELDIIPMDLMIWVIKDGVKVLRVTADYTLRGVAEVVWIAERAVVDGVVQAMNPLSAEEIVDRAVLHDDEDDSLDLVLQVGDRVFSCWC